ncbi:interleukin-1 receptor type 1 isoform X1 [Danio rerio]|uniref:Interleukin-1 receptor type 1 isoform X1 n=1 Tax=Danio rerio TaxID=7955 RepID=A0ACD6B7S2_DANRE
MILLPRKPVMNFSTLYFRSILLFALWISGSVTHLTHRKTYTFVAGLAFNLQCNRDSQNVTVNWTRVPSRSLESITGMNIKDNTLWFLPADLTHQGSYSCFSRKGNDTWETIFEVSVSNETCPHWNRKDELTSTAKLECFLPHIFKIDPQAQVTWRKNCQPLNMSNSKVLLVDRSTEMIGLLTCFVNFTFEGQNYLSAQTTEVYMGSTVDVVTPPKLIYPKPSQTHKVTLGQSYKINCKALVGMNDDDDTDLYWYTDSDSLRLDFDLSRFKEGDQEYLLSVLSISEVTAEHLNINFTCKVDHPAGSDSGRVVLILASQNERYYWVGVGLVALLILLLALLFLCRVDLVLAYRSVCSRSVACSDGKWYDAYVSSLNVDPLSSSSAMTFALHFLPSVLEDLYGYRLFISGRDELPGEAIQDVVSDRMNRSRRLIIILTSQSCSSPQKHASDKALDSECKSSYEALRSAYEQRVGLYDALVKQGLKVILVQVEDGVEEHLLPESLKYISRTQGILNWRENAREHANRRFWKHMRYRMPACQRRKGTDSMVL